jgi:hypothetical protein
MVGGALVLVWFFYSVRDEPSATEDVGAPSSRLSPGRPAFDQDGAASGA